MFTEGLFEYIFPELKESEDEKIRKELIFYLRYQHSISENFEDIGKWIAWLEKQGEQKPQGKTALEAIKEEKLDNANKVEPKFHVGDWIVNNTSNDIFLIKSVNNGYYILEDTKGRIYSPCLPPIAIEDNNHLWTIKDAKDGDVLTYSDSKHTWLCIFKELKNSRCYDYCSYGNKDEVGFWPRSNWNYDKTLSYKPATKDYAEFKEAKQDKKPWVSSRNCKPHQHTGKSYDSECKRISLEISKLKEKISLAV